MNGWRELNLAIWMEICYSRFLEIANIPDTEMSRLQFNGFVQTQLQRTTMDSLTLTLAILPKNLMSNLGLGYGNLSSMFSPTPAPSFTTPTFTRITSLDQLQEYLGGALVEEEEVFFEGAPVDEAEYESFRDEELN